MNTLSNLAAHHPVLAFIALTVVVVAIGCGLAAVFDWLDQRLETRDGISDLEHFVNDPASHTRKEEL